MSILGFGGQHKRIAFLGLVVFALGCGPSDSEKTEFIERCRKALPTEADGWIDPSFGPFDFHRSAPVAGADYGGEPPPFEAVATVGGRGPDGRRRVAPATCRGFEGKTAQVGIGTPDIAPLAPADKSWLHQEILARAMAAEKNRDFSAAVALLRGSGPIRGDTTEWIQADTNYRALLSRTLKEKTEDDKRIIRERAKAEREQAKQAAENARTEKAAAIVRGKAAREERREYAKQLRIHFLDTGSDIEVSASGSNADRLVLRYVLFNAVWVRKFQTGDLISEVRAKGFRSVVFDDIYSNAWTIHLTE